jgi:hypothetical protein
MYVDLPRDRSCVCLSGVVVTHKKFNPSHGQNADAGVISVYLTKVNQGASRENIACRAGEIIEVRTSSACQNPYHFATRFVPYAESNFYYLLPYIHHSKLLNIGDELQTAHCLAT